MRTAAPPSSPRYRVLEEEIIGRIRDGSLAPGARLDSPEELTRELDASPSTIRLTLQSLASRGILVRIPRRGTMVSREAMQIIGSARSAKKANQLALLVPDVRLPEYAALAGAVLDVVEEFEKEAAVYSTDDDRERYHTFILRCIAQGCAGLIIVPPLYSQLKPETLLAIEQARLPVVTCWRPVEALSAPVIRTDPSKSAYDMTQHMLQAGCKVIATVSFYSPVYEFQFTRLAALDGYRRALSAAGICPADSWQFDYPMFIGPKDVVNCESNPAFQQLMQWLKRHPEIDAIVCQHDALAILVNKAIAMIQRCVPGDILLSGIGNNLPYTSMMHPSLTTYEFDLKDFVRRAINLLGRIRDGNRPPHGHHEIIDGHIIPGGSTARIRMG